MAGEIRGQLAGHTLYTLSYAASPDSDMIVKTAGLKVDPTQAT
jgi:hypothetical protein